MRINRSLIGASVLALGTFMTGVSLHAQGNSGKPTSPSYEHGDVIRGGGPHNGPTGGAVVTGNGINYNGGPVMHPVNLYYILYGDWSGQDSGGPALMQTWGKNIAPSPYFNINTTYGDSTGANVPNLVTFGGVYNDTTDYATYGISLTDSTIATITTTAIYGGFTGGLVSPPIPAGTPDPNGLYMVLTAPGVNETTGFLTSYCGWHWSGSFINGAITPGTIYSNTPVVKFAFIGDAAGYYSCTAQQAPSPNGDVGVDSMFSVMAHELSEAASDPEGNAWFASNGEENGDLCAWNFGTESTLPNGAKYNVTLNGANYLMQQIWLNAGGGSCALSYAAGPDFSVAVSGSQTIAHGTTSGNYTLTDTPSNGFSGTVTWTFSPPAGITVNPAANPLTGTPATFTLSALSTLAAGTYTVPVTGMSGALHHTVNATVVVTAPDFSVSVSSSQSVPAGGTSGTYTATAKPVNGFNANNVVWTFSPPTGFTVTPTSALTGSSVTFTVTAPSGATPATYSIGVTGSYGSLTHSVNASLVVTAPSYSLTITPSSQSVTRPTSGTKTVTYTVTVNSIGGFAGSVSLKVSGGATGVTPSITAGSNPPVTVVSPGGGTGTLSVAVTNSATNKGAKAKQTFTVTGTSGTTSKTGTATITIQ